MVNRKKASDQQIIESYSRLNSIWKVGEELGMCGQSIQERLVKLNIPRNLPGITVMELDRIKEVYQSGIISGDGKLKLLSKEINRTIPFISRYANIMGLTNISREKTETFKKEQSIKKKEWYKKNEHPRGMLNKTHTKDVRDIISKSTKKKWSEMTDQELYDRAKKTHETCVKNGIKRGVNGDSKKSWKAQWATIGGKKHYYRSHWEVNYACYLEFLKRNKSIKDWEYEPETFWFESIKRGVRSYKPDFKVYENNGNIVYHEVKGWMDSRSKTTISRMRKYYPEKKLIIIDAPKYKEIGKKLGSAIKGWT